MYSGSGGERLFLNYLLKKDSVQRTSSTLSASFLIIQNDVQIEGMGCCGFGSSPKKIGRQGHDSMMFRDSSSFNSMTQ